MTFANTGFQDVAVMGTPDGTAGSRRQIHSYITSDAPATVETSDYFLSVYSRLKANDVLLVSYTGTVRRLRSYIVDTSSSSGVTIKREDDADATGSGVRAVVPTADGLTTGLILDSDSFVELTSADANHIATLPTATAATRGREINIFVAGATACELRTPATSNQTINNVDSDASEAALVAGSTYRAFQHKADGWLLTGLTNLGAVATAIVPD